MAEFETTRPSTLGLMLMQVQEWMLVATALSTAKHAARSITLVLMLAVAMNSAAVVMDTNMEASGLVLVSLAPAVALWMLTSAVRVKATPMLALELVQISMPVPSVKVMAIKALELAPVLVLVLALAAVPTLLSVLTLAAKVTDTKTLKSGQASASMLASVVRVTVTKTQASVLLKALAVQSAAKLKATKVPVPLREQELALAVMSKSTKVSALQLVLVALLVLAQVSVLEALAATVQARPVKSTKRPTATHALVLLPPLT